MRRTAATLLVCLLAGSWPARQTRAAEAPRADSDLVAECAREIGERFLATAPDYLQVMRQAITRSDKEDLVKLTVEAGEGRTASAVCKFRAGKLFDVVR
jgi:hypothetical protein